MKPAIALYQPSIPPNTGNIGRLCVGFGVELFLIGPMGFEINDTTLKRAGLDYWKYLNYTIYQGFEEFFKVHCERRIIVLSKFSDILIYDFEFQLDDIILMGNEIKGIPQELTTSHGLTRIRIPMLKEIRSYNLANASAMAISECYRQLSW